MPRVYSGDGRIIEKRLCEGEFVEDVLDRIHGTNIQLNPSQNSKDFYVAYCYTCGQLRDSINARTHFEYLLTECEGMSMEYDESVFSSFINFSDGSWTRNEPDPKSVFDSVHDPVEQICLLLCQHVDQCIDALHVLLQILIKSEDEDLFYDILSTEILKKDLERWLKYQEQSMDEKTLLFRLFNKITVSDEYNFPMCESADLVSCTIVEMASEMGAPIALVTSLAEKRCIKENPKDG